MRATNLCSSRTSPGSPASQFSACRSAISWWLRIRYLRLLACACLAFAALSPESAYAAPEEIVVFADEFEKRGDVGYELHVNYAARGRRTSDFPGEQPPQGILRVMPEVVFGIAEKWNLGLHLPMSHNTHTGTVSADGFKVRMQYLDTRDTGTGSMFYGANYELSYLSERLSESRLVAEVRGIVGWRHNEWLLALNPIINRPLNYVPGVDNRVNFDLFSKIMRSFGHDLAIGIEHYAEFGKVRNLTFGPESGQITYAVAEFSIGRHFDVQIGVGHGWTAPVDKRVYKVMLGLPF